MHRLVCVLSDVAIDNGQGCVRMTSPPVTPRASGSRVGEELGLEAGVGQEGCDLDPIHP
jgi:hypothetical protein